MEDNDDYTKCAGTECNKPTKGYLHCKSCYDEIVEREATDKPKP